MKPQPTDKLDATTYVAVNGPAGDALLNDERIVRLHATGPTRACLSRVLGNGHALVLRGARHSNVSGLPVHSKQSRPGGQQHPRAVRRSSSARQLDVQHLSSNQAFGWL